MSAEQVSGPQSRVDPSLAYERARLPEGVVLRLDANEGPPAATEFILDVFRANAGELLRRYPDPKPLEAALARTFSIQPAQAFVSAGADDVIDRCCRAFLPASGTMLIAEPSFEMFEQYASLCGAKVDGVAWTRGSYPIDAMLGKIDAGTAVIALVSPNNPTGEVASLEDLRRLAAAAPNALVILDHAYVDFASEDLTAAALTMPNVVVVRTFSKAWGIAGCRVGYALGPAGLIKALRAAGGPFPASAASLAIARAMLERGAGVRDAYVARIEQERRELYELLLSLGANPRPSQTNFIFAELGERSRDVHTALIAHGVLVRLFSRHGTPLGLRISLPGDPGGFEILVRAVRGALGAGASA